MPLKLLHVYSLSTDVTSSKMVPPQPAAPSSAMGRDAVQEVDEHPEEFMASSHSMGSNHSGKPVSPGERPQAPGKHQCAESNSEKQVPDHSSITGHLRGLSWPW